jgi:hypothetical protein
LQTIVLAEVEQKVGHSRQNTRVTLGSKWACVVELDGGSDRCAGHTCALPAKLGFSADQPKIVAGNEVEIEAGLVLEG